MQEIEKEKERLAGEMLKWHHAGFVPTPDAFKFYRHVRRLSNRTGQTKAELMVELRKLAVEMAEQARKDEDQAAIDRKHQDRDLEEMRIPEDERHTQD